MTTKKYKEPKIPKSLAACADLLFTVDRERKSLNKYVESVELFESKLKQHIIDNLPKDKATGIAGKLARVAVEKNTIPTVENWEKLYAFIIKTKAFDLLQRRVSREAVKARWEDNKVVPGVGKFMLKTLSINVVKKKGE